jgi:hypothetical protein
VYFNDGLKANLKFRQFIVKYATLIKCEDDVFYHILFEIYKDHFERDIMTEEEFSNVVKSETEYFGIVPRMSGQFDLKRFIEVMKEAMFKVEEYQGRLAITTE